MKKKNNWCIYTPPTFWQIEPHEPKKTFTKSEFKCFFSTTESYIRLDDISIQEGIVLADVVIDVEHISGDFGCDLKLQFGTTTTVTVENPNYDAQMEDYKHRLESWQKAKKEHKQEVKDWKAWKKQEEKAEKSKKLEEARKLLESNGMTVLPVTERRSEFSKHSPGAVNKKDDV